MLLPWTRTRILAYTRKCLNALTLKNSKPRPASNIIITPLITTDTNLCNANIFSINNLILRINNQQGVSSMQNFYFVTKLYMFWASSVPIIRSFSCTRGNWYVSCRLCGRCIGESGSSSNLTLLGSGHITCMKYTNCHVYTSQLTTGTNAEAQSLECLVPFR